MYARALQVTGVLQHTDFLKEWVGHPDVLYARPLVQVRACVDFVLCALTLYAGISAGEKLGVEVGVECCVCAADWAAALC